MTDKKFFILSIIVSVVVFSVVVILNIIPKADYIPSFVRQLPLLNAFLNGTCSILLLLSLYFIKQKNIQAHKKINLTALFLSAIFLVSYILYHYFYATLELFLESAFLILKPYFLSIPLQQRF